MKKNLIMLTACALFCSIGMAQTPNKLTNKEKKQGWKLLFDGKTNAGWHTYLKDTVGSKWQVKDGVIIFDPSQPESGGGDLVTNEEYENYELTWNGKSPKVGTAESSSTFRKIRSIVQLILTGPEMQVLDNIDAADNKKQNHLAGSLYDLVGDSTVSKPKPVGEWNQVRLIQDKGHLTFYLNGVKTFDGKIGDEEWNSRIAKSKFSNEAFKDFAKVAKGKIALQEHPGSSQWRNIKIKML